MNTQAFRPFGDAHRLALKGQQSICSTIALLLTASRPPHITGLVVAVVVNAVDAVRRGRLLSHVRNERCKPCFSAPSVAHTNSPSTVILKLWVMGIATAIVHRLKHLVFRGATESVPEMAASTRRRATTSEKRGANWMLFLSACKARTYPSSVGVPSGSTALVEIENLKASKDLARQINQRATRPAHDFRATSVRQYDASRHDAAFYAGRVVEVTPSVRSAGRCAL